MKILAIGASSSLLAVVAVSQVAAQSAEQQLVTGSETPRCYGIVTVVGDERHSVSKAQRAADDLLMGRIRFDYGERYADLNHAEEVNHFCTSSLSPGGRFYRCKVWARACRPPPGESIKIERRYEEETDDDD